MVVAALLTLAANGCLGLAPSVGGGPSSSSSTTGGSSSEGVAPDSTGSGIMQTPACAAYLDCLSTTDPEGFPEAEKRFGVDGPCWDNPSYAEQCQQQCLDRLEAACTDDSGGDTGDGILLCSIEGLLPGAPSPVDAGRDEGQLPLEVGIALEDNCGCHYIDGDDLDPSVPAYYGAIPLRTWADFQGNFMGQPVAQRVRQRSIVEVSMPPPYYCDDLDIGALSVADYSLLSDWLDAGAPDAATWSRMDKTNTASEKTR